MVRLQPGIRVFVRIHSEPGALGRVLQPFQVLSLTPHALTLRPSVRQTAFVVAEFVGLPPDRALILMEKLRQMPCVYGARCSEFAHAGAA